MIPKIILLGGGNFGKNHLRNLNNLHQKGKIKLVGVIDKDPKVLKKIKKEYSVPTSSDHKKFLDMCDTVDIVTPASTHYNLVKYFLNNKKHVFVEKPLALNSKEANELVSIANKKKRNLQVGHIFRFNSVIENLKTIIRREGNYPYYIVGKFLQSKKPRTDIGAVFNYLHHFDILDNILDLKPKMIFAHSNLYLKNGKHETNAKIFLKYTKKLTASLNLGWIPSGKYRTLELYSEKNHIKCDLEKQKIEIYQNGKLSKIISPKHKEPLLLELLEFINCIKNHKKPRVDGKLGARIVRIAEISLQSSKNGKIMKFS